MSFLTARTIFAIAIAWFLQTSDARSNSNCPLGASMNIVAHEDDDTLFLSPDLLHDIQDHRCVRTVFVTAGDANLGPGYAEDRMIGARAAYASMAGVPSDWSTSSIVVSGRHLLLYTLNGDPQITLVFLALPDGQFFGGGFAHNKHQSLRKLVAGKIPAITSIDGSETYTLDELKATLLELISEYQPDQLRAQDYRKYVLDHSDHHAVANLVLAVEPQIIVPHVFTAYRDYVTLLHLQNLSSDDRASKVRAFQSYVATDSQIRCYTCFWNPYHAWLRRQYAIRSEHRPQ